VAAAAARVGRRADEITVVAMTKGAGAEEIAEAVGAGLTDLGENDARRLAAKAATVDGVRWHFAGRLQTNKIRYLRLGAVSLIHSLAREREAMVLQARGDAAGRDWDVLVQVNVSGEPQKGGVAPAELGPLLEALSGYRRVRPRGLMFVAPQVENAEDVRAMFAEARGLRDRYADLGLSELSMGMSDDFEVAVEEGSTIVRIGRAIFAPGGPANNLMDGEI
jgi:pyridoxal phosphate enzyme (YggS family)